MILTIFTPMNDSETSSCESSPNSSSCESSSSDSNSSSKFTTVKTVYARAAVVLLALNFCLTGYVVLNMSQSTQEQIEGIQTQQSARPQESKTASTQTPTGSSQTPETLESQGKPQVKTLDQ